MRNTCRAVPEGQPASSPAAHDNHGAHAASATPVAMVEDEGHDCCNAAGLMRIEQYYRKQNCQRITLNCI